jgi:hypothetical protein
VLKSIVGGKGKGRGMNFKYEIQYVKLKNWQKNETQYDAFLWVILIFTEVMIGTAF